MRPTRTLIALVALLALVVVVVAIAVVLDRSDDRTTGVATGVATAATTTVTTAAPVSTLPSGIAALAVAEPSHEDSYDRDLFGSGWIDTDQDCQNTRAEVLIAESRVAVAFTSPTDCTVASGDWLDPWSGAQLTSARALDIDHTVPLANAWRSGAWAWTTEQRRAYANDLTDVDHLVAIGARREPFEGRRRTGRVEATEPRQLVRVRPRLDRDQGEVEPDREPGGVVRAAGHERNLLVSAP